MTSEARVYRQASEVDFIVGELPQIPLPDAVLFVRPAHYQVAYVINPHMEGHIGSVDTEAALMQWTNVVNVYRTLDFAVHVLEGQPGLPDMVFCANQTLPCVESDGRSSVVPASMLAPERRDEVLHVVRFFEDVGYHIHPAPDAPFEGMGDAIWQFDRQLLWIGTGFRTTSEAAVAVSTSLNVKVVELSLVDPFFYHLDTCLSILDVETALWVPSAFDEAGRGLLESLFPRLLTVPRDEAVSSLACNAHCPDGHNVIMQAGCHHTVRLLRDNGFEVFKCDTGEFLKAGGSVFCMKQMFWAAG